MLIIDKNIEMTYSDPFLFLCGILGILLHCLMKIIQLKKKNNFDGKKYLSDAWPEALFSLVFLILCVMLKNEIRQLKQADGYLGVGFAFGGYMAQSILVTVLGKANGIIGIKDDEPKNDES